MLGGVLNFGRNHEKVRHFVGDAFLCFQGVTSQITLHGVSLNFAQSQSPVERSLGSSAEADSGCRLISQARLSGDLGAPLDRIVNCQKAMRRSSREPGRTERPIDLPDSTDLPSAIDLPGSTCRGHREPCSRGLGSPIHVDTGSPIIGAKNRPGSR